MHIKPIPYFIVALSLLGLSDSQAALAGQNPRPTLSTPAGAQAAVARHTMGELRGIIAAGLESGKHSIVIPPGVYKGTPEKGRGVHLLISDVSDIEIIADGVTMLCGDPRLRAIEFHKCKNVTLQGLTVDYDPLPFTQGDIVTVNQGEGWLDVKIHAGYSICARPRVNIVDRTTRYRKTDEPFMWDSKAEVREGGMVRIHSKTAAAFAKVGDLASLGGDDPTVHTAPVAHALTIENCAAVTLRNVAVFSSNCMGIVASGGVGGHHFIGCRVVPGPPPPGATEARILSTDADAILTENLRKGVLTENCEIRDAADDTWSVTSPPLIIVKREGKTIWLAHSLGIQAGDRLQASIDGPTGTVVSATDIAARDVMLDTQMMQKVNAGGARDYWHLDSLLPNGRLWKVVFDSDIPWRQGDSVYNLDHQGNGFVFRNNNVHSSGRILIKASGVVEGNRIEGPFCISVLPEVPYYAATGIESIVIRDNTIIDAHLFNPFRSSSQAGAISVTDQGPKHNLRDAGTYGKVIIENNTIRGGNGAGIVVSSARNVVIRNNRLEDLLHISPNITGADWKIDNHAAVWLAHCDRVTLSNNLLLNPGSEMSQPLVIGPGVKTVEGGLSVSAGTFHTAAVSSTGFQTVPLSSLGLKQARQYGNAAVEAGETPDRKAKNVPTLNGNADTQGISARGGSAIAFDLKGAGERFTALVGIDDSVNKAFRGPAECMVYGDGKLLWRSGQLKAGQPQNVDVDLRGVKILELIGDASGDNAAEAYLDWLHATLRYAGQKPVGIEPPVLPSEPLILSPKPSAKPRINGARVFGVRPGAPFLFRIAASGQRPMHFTAEGLPAGLTLDADSGQITGSLKEPGEYDVHLRANNMLGEAERSLRIVAGEKIALSPAMGWSSWNCWGANVDQEKVLHAARALVSSGLIDHGFSYVNIDDAWQAKRGGPFNALQGNEKFPDMKGMCNEIHRLGLKAGIYSTPWVGSYAGYPGGSSDNPNGDWEKTKDSDHVGKYLLMENDAKQWAAWGLDYLKCDWWPPKPNEAKFVAEALRKCGRDIELSLSCDAPFAYAPGAATKTASNHSRPAC
jgi:hypothetical protein